MQPMGTSSFSSAISASCKAIFMKYSSENIEIRFYGIIQNSWLKEAGNGNEPAFRLSERVRIFREAGTLRFPLAG